MPVLLALLILSAPAAAAPAARLVHMTGRVELERPKASAKAAREGLALEDGDSVRTWDESAAVIRLADGSRLKLRENSRIKLELSKSRAGLGMGGVFAELAPQRRSFELRAAAVTAAVRGTRFFASLGAKSRKGEVVWLCVDEGSVEVKSDNVPGSALVNAGLGVRIAPGEPLPRPSAFEWTRKLNWNMDPGKGRLEDRTKPTAD